jgi:hypothetical protein
MHNIASVASKEHFYSRGMTFLARYRQWSESSEVSGVGISAMIKQNLNDVSVPKYAGMVKRRKAVVIFFVQGIRVLLD